MTDDALLVVIREVHADHADDTCWMSIDRIFAAAGLPVPDRRVGNKEAMLVNCRRYVDTMCSGGEWKSYAELEAEISAVRQEWDNKFEEHENLLDMYEALEDEIERLRGIIASLCERTARASEVIAKFTSPRSGYCVECGSQIGSGRICEVCCETLARGIL